MVLCLNLMMVRGSKGKVSVTQGIKTIQTFFFYQVINSLMTKVPIT